MGNLGSGTYAQVTSLTTSNLVLQTILVSGLRCLGVGTQADDEKNLPVM